MSDQPDPLLIAFDRFVTAVDWSDHDITFAAAFSEAVDDWIAQLAAETDTELPPHDMPNKNHLSDAISLLADRIGARGTAPNYEPTLTDNAIAEALNEWVRTRQPGTA